MYGEKRGHNAFWMETLREKSHMERPRIGKMIIPKRIFRN
jgi:hypothetical protein